MIMSKLVAVVHTSIAQRMLTFVFNLLLILYIIATPRLYYTLWFDQLQIHDYAITSSMTSNSKDNIGKAVLL